MKSSTAALVIAVVLLLFGSTACVAFSEYLPVNPRSEVSTQEKSRIPTLDKLIGMKQEEMSLVDVATMNLVCATGLPGSENLKIDDCLAVLDQWARRVQSETERCFYMYRRDPSRFRNIEGFYRMQMLVTVLKQDLGVDYSPNRTNNESMENFFADSKDLFLNGLLLPPHTGTCGSLPILVVAIGRKLGYPLKLVKASHHLFVRWESPDGKERFNVESTNGGMVSKPDEHYTQGIYECPAELSQAEEYLKSLSPTEELAVFLDSRLMCLRVNKRFTEAREVPGP